MEQYIYFMDSQPNESAIKWPVNVKSSDIVLVRQLVQGRDKESRT